ncbi:MAG: hypothetical protein KAX50_05960 [Saprospiraceae bacterium]|nr:hypothetical protein [Saprospiraceae bacterium]
MKKVFFLVIAIAALAGAAAGYYLWNKPHQNISKAEAAHSVEANALFVEFESDEAAANTKYLSKIIEVKGEVSQVLDGKNTTIVLATENGIFGVKCELDPHSKVAFPDYKSGDQVALKGECTGFLGDVVLVRCVPSER